MSSRSRGTTLVVGLMLLAVVTLLGLAGAGGAHIERQLARNEQFRENAASAASAGIEYAISRIVSSSIPDTDAAPVSVSATLRDSADRFEIVTRFVGLETALPQTDAENLAGAHFEVDSAGYSGGGAIDRQRVGVMLVVPAPVPATPPECAPEMGIPCFQRGELLRLSWQRLPSS